jgi:tRNA isopentenyl-2-thiomethyl-A-37 hydroxylase MiaE
VSDAPIDHLADLTHTDLMRVIVALATELYALADQLESLKEALAARGIDLAALDAPREAAAYDDAARARRDQFVARIFGALAQPQGKR